MGGAIVDSGKFDWMKYPDKFPSLTQPEPAYHGLTFAETFGQLAFTLYGHAVGLRDLGPCMAPINAYLTITGMFKLVFLVTSICLAPTLPVPREKDVTGMTGQGLGDGAGLLPGIETLPLRMERHCANGLAVAEFLGSHPQVSWVSHAGLESNKYRPLAVKYLRGHGGSVFTFGLKGGYQAGINVGELAGPCLPPVQVVFGDC